MQLQQKNRERIERQWNIYRGKKFLKRVIWNNNYGYSGRYCSGWICSCIKYKSLNNTVEETTKDESDINKEADTYEVKDNAESAPEILKEEVKDEHNNNNINFNKDKMIALINTNDLDGIYEQIKDIKQESITSDDQEVYKQAVDLIKNQGVSKIL